MERYSIPVTLPSQQRKSSTEYRKASFIYAWNTALSGLGNG